MVRLMIIPLVTGTAARTGPSGPVRALRPARLLRAVGKYRVEPGQRVPSRSDQYLGRSGQPGTRALGRGVSRSLRRASATATGRLGLRHPPGGPADRAPCALGRL